MNAPPAERNPVVSSPAGLPQLLRELRESHFSRKLTQGEVAAAVGLSVPSISSWESVSKPKTPSDRTLRRIATFYATPRSLEGDAPQILRDDVLTADERASRDKLLAQFLDLGRQARGTESADRSDWWTFDDTAKIRIIVGALDEADQSEFASPEKPNHMSVSAYADQDALLELWGHIRMANPLNDSRFERADRLMADDHQGHLAILGNMGWVQGAGRVYIEDDIPVRQIKVDDIADGEIFEIEDEGQKVQFRPRFTERGAVTEDVGFFLRTRSPINTDCTLTICSGVYTRGVLGAVRMLTDVNLRESNAAYLATRFPDAETFGILVRVPVHGGVTVTPDLRDPRNRLFEFPRTS